MRRLKFAMGSALTAVVLAAMLPAARASACSLMKFSDDGRYVGGGLVEQIVEKAHQIDIVTASNRYLVSRTFTQGTWYLQFGDLDVPGDRPEFTDAFVFALDTVEVLKPNRYQDDFLTERALRISGYDTNVWGETAAGRAGANAHFNSLPSWLLDRPGHEGYAFIGASENNGLGSGECTSPYLLEVGQHFVALRDSGGRLYTDSGAFPLAINAEFRLLNGRVDKVTLNMQSLIPISGPDDPFVARLRLALSASRP